MALWLRTLLGTLLCHICCQLQVSLPSGWVYFSLFGRIIEQYFLRQLKSTPCREKLITQGRSNVDDVRRSLVKTQAANEIKALHLKESCWDVMAVPAAQIVPVGQTSLSCGLANYEPTEERTTRFATLGLVLVNNMPIRKLSQAESLRLQQVHKPRVQQYVVLATLGICCSVPFMMLSKRKVVVCKSKTVYSLTAGTEFEASRI